MALAPCRAWTWSSSEGCSCSSSVRAAWQDATNPPGQALPPAPSFLPTLSPIAGVPAGAGLWESGHRQCPCSAARLQGAETPGWLISSRSPCPGICAKRQHGTELRHRAGRGWSAVSPAPSHSVLLLPQPGRPSRRPGFSEGRRKERRRCVGVGGQSWWRTPQLHCPLCLSREMPGGHGVLAVGGD